MHPLIPWFQAPVVTIPVINFPLHGFGFLVALGFVFGGRVAMDRAKRMGLDPEVINRLIGWLVVGTFVGGHVGYGLMYKPKEYLADPMQFLYMWQGLSSFGGFVFCVPVSIWFFRKEKVPIWPFLDCLAYGMALGWFFGRMGCFVAHDHPGTITNFWLGVYGICQPDNARNVACHDLGLYEALWSLSMFGLFQVLDRLPLKPGTLVLTLGLCYGPLRFTMDFFRPEVTDARYAGFTPGQYWSAIFTLVAVGALAARLRSPDPKLPPAGVPAAPAAA